MKSRAEAKRKETKPLWHCDHCPLMFDSATLLNIHNLTHAAEERFSIDNQQGTNNALLHLSAAAAQIDSGIFSNPLITMSVDTSLI